MRILWYSNSPHVGSGYGNQTDTFVTRIAGLGHEIGIAAFWGVQGGLLDSAGIPIYPSSMSGGIDHESMQYPAQHFEADVIISLLDFWAMPPGMNGTYPLCPWFPIDHEPLQPPIVQRLRGGMPNLLMPIVFSKFGQQMMKSAGFDHRYVPHGYDDAVYNVGMPNDEDPAPYDRGMSNRQRMKRQARDYLGLPQDKFIIGIVAANTGSPSRKALKQQIHAFSLLRQRHSDVHLYLHTLADTTPYRNIAGENLGELIQQLGIVDSVSFTEPIPYYTGVESSDMAQIYRSFDVLSSVSMGEGFGIPILEAQACGVPVIVGDWTSMSELNFSGWSVDKVRGAEPYHTTLGAYQFWPRIRWIATLYEEAYQCGSIRMDNRSDIAVRRAQEYAADRVTEVYWRPVLDEIAGWIEDRKQTKGFDQYTQASKNGAALTVVKA